MGFITGITGAAAGPEGEARVESQEPEVEVRLPEPEVKAASDPEFEPLPKPVREEEPGPGLRERGYSMVGRAMRFVMQRVTPVVWQAIVQRMAEHLPVKIKLEPTAELQWENATRHKHLIEDLADQGFVDVGVFFVASMETKMHLLVNEAYDIRAVVYEHENSGIVLDLVTLFGDGTGITYVNREDPGIEQSPLHPNVYLGDEPVFEMLDTCLRERPKKARMPEPPAAAVRLMEMEYEFGSRRLRGEPINPVEIADAYLEAIEQSAAAVPVEDTSEPIVEEKKPNAPRWTGRPQSVLPPLDEAMGLAVAEEKGKPAKAGR